jgi:hypothetical protein
MDYVVDHVPPNNTLDNRRTMLRIVTRKINSRNKRKRKGTSSQYHGVSIVKKTGKFQVMIMIDSIRHYIGEYKTEYEGARAYDAYLLSLSENQRFGYNLNFPNDQRPLTESKAPKQPRTSKYNGVHCAQGAFRTKIRLNKKVIFHFRTYDEIECAKKYDENVVKLGLNKKLNFPADYPNYVPPRKIKTEKIFDDGIVVHCKIDSTEETIIIDADVYETTVKYHKISSDRSGYARIYYNKTIFLLHRFIMSETNPTVYIDHIDRNKLNNVRSNLKRTTAQENVENKTKQKNKTSKYVGVHKSKRLFAATVKRKEFRYEKLHKTEEHAARDRDLVIMTRFPDSNFPLAFTWTPEEIVHWKQVLGKE